MDYDNFEEYMGMSLSTPANNNSGEEDPKHYITDAQEHITVIYDEDTYLVRIIFSSMPTGLTRAILKTYDFRWEADLASWVRSMGDQCIVDHVDLLLSALEAELTDD